MLSQSVNLCSFCAGIARTKLQPPGDLFDICPDSHTWYEERPIPDFLLAARSSCRICQLYFDSSDVEDLRKVISNGVIEWAGFGGLDIIKVYGAWGIKPFFINLLCVWKVCGISTSFEIK